MAARKRANRALLDELEPGDLIEIKRGTYSHYAVYAGHKRVVHLVGIRASIIRRHLNGSFSIGGERFNRAEVKEEDFWKVVGKSVARKNNYLDEKYHPLPGHQVVAIARSHIGPAEYDVLFNNCEHFATKCRYFQSVSRQAESFIERCSKVVLGVARAVAIFFGGLRLFAISRRN
ncbi:phospholipase A and acyltransferase 4-like [Babylonia areolata]|uniref:phospholipase A and acyltransferase 4-like n=1 Tax=Babylonia areolata TaxID=304850 RepID=UPI003FD2C94E